MGLGVLGLLFAVTPFGFAGGVIFGALGLALALVMRRGKLRKVALWVNGVAVATASIVILSYWA